MSLALASQLQLKTILNESYEIWHSGLSIRQYFSLNQRLLNLNWAKTNYQFLVLLHKNQVLGGLKFYQLHLRYNNRVYKLAGLGAIYILKKYRNLGYSSELINQVVQLCLNQNYDGIILFSDLKPEFYNKFGFEVLAYQDFNFIIKLDNNDGAINSSNQLNKNSYICTDLEQKSIAWLSPIYNECNKHNPLGILRNENYWSFKIFKENYLARFSQIKWPKIQTLIDLVNEAYILYEVNNLNARILEIQGKNPDYLVNSLMNNCIQQSITDLKMFEANEKYFTNMPNFAEQSFYSPRNWGIFMLLALSSDLKNSFTGLRQLLPFPIQELDYL